MSTTDNVQYRVATLEDAPKLQHLIESAFRAADTRPNWTGDMKLSEGFRLDIKEVEARINKPDSVLLVAHNNQEPFVGTVNVFKAADGYARVALLAIKTEYQQGGTGRRLLFYAEDYCKRTWGASRIGLNALSTRELLMSWYMRCGYEKTGELTPFPKLASAGRETDGLHFVEMLKNVPEPGA